MLKRMNSQCPAMNQRLHDHPTRPATQDADYDDLDWAYDWYAEDHADGYEAPGPYDMPDLSDSDDDMEMHAEDHMVDALVVAGADPNLAKMHVKAMLQVEPQKPTT